jgi:HlyD family secretion protein
MEVGNIVSDLEVLVELLSTDAVQGRVVNGLEPGNRVILYPASGVSDGMRVVQREIQ